jgi:hypothetical protein
MVIKYKSEYSQYQDLPIRWIYRDYYRVTDEKLLFLMSVERGFTFDRIEEEEYQSMIYKEIYNPNEKRLDISHPMPYTLNEWSAKEFDSILQTIIKEHDKIELTYENNQT